MATSYNGSSSGLSWPITQVTIPTEMADGDPLNASSGQTPVNRNADIHQFWAEFFVRMQLSNWVATEINPASQTFVTGAQLLSFNGIIFGVPTPTGTTTSSNGMGPFKSIDGGKTWQNVGTSGNPFGNVGTPNASYGIKVVNGRLFVFGGVLSGTAKLASTPDGATWTDHSSAVGATLGCIFDMTWNGTVYILVGQNTTNNGPGVSTSPDLTTFTTRTSNIGGANQIQKVAYDGTRTVLVSDYAGSNTAQCSSSTDGLTWTARTLATTGQTPNFLKNPANSLFVLGGTNGMCQTSTDGTTWTARTSQFSTSVLYDLDYVGSTYVIVGQAGKISSSPDGTTWTARTSGVTADLKVITHLTNFLAPILVGGDSGVILHATSPTGSWALRQTYSTLSIKGFASVDSTCLAAVGFGSFMGQVYGPGLAAEATPVLMGLGSLVLS